MDKVRVGIVGTGFAGRFHYDSLQGIVGIPVEVVGVTSRRAESRTAFAEQRGIRAFDTLSALIEASDIVDICAPPYVHEEITIAAAERGKDIVLEKPFTGAFTRKSEHDAGTGETWNEARLREAVASAERMAEAVRSHGVRLSYAENWVFAPGIQKTARLLLSACSDPATQILWIKGEESHSGSTSPVYGDSKFAGGGSIVGKGCHPLTAALYLKRLEGIAKTGAPVVPSAVSAQIANLTQNAGYRTPTYRNPTKLRCDYVDGEDYSGMHVIFSDGTVADIFAAEVKLGGVYNWMETCANTFFARTNLSPNNPCVAYTPSGELFESEYLLEKLETKEGYSFPSVDEGFFLGYHSEMQLFIERTACPEKEPALPLLPAEQDLALGIDTTKVMYAAYLSAEREGRRVQIE